MYRVGIYTLKVYSQSDFDNGEIKECARAFHSRDQARAAVKSPEIAASHAKCGQCLQCPIAKFISSHSSPYYPVALD